MRVLGCNDGDSETYGTVGPQCYEGDSEITAAAGGHRGSEPDRPRKRRAS